MSKATTALFLALYLVILAFFILLNTLSEIDIEKKAKTIQSVKDKFLHVLHHEDSIEPVIETNLAGSQLRNFSYFDQVGKISKDFAELVKGSIAEYGNKIELTFPEDAAFEDGQAVLKSQYRDFIIKVADNIARTPKGRRIDIEFFISSKNQKDLAPPTARNDISIARTGVVARKLVELGVNNRAVSVGIDNSLQNVVTMSFYDRLEDQAEVKITE